MTSRGTSWLPATTGWPVAGGDECRGEGGRRRRSCPAPPSTTTAPPTLHTKKALRGGGPLRHCHGANAEARAHVLRDRRREEGIEGEDVHSGGIRRRRCERRSSAIVRGGNHLVRRRDAQAANTIYLNSRRRMPRPTSICLLEDEFDPVCMLSGRCVGERLVIRDEGPPEP